MSEETDRFMEGIRNNFSPESTDEEILMFLHACLLLDGKLSEILIMGYAIVRTIGYSPFDALVKNMDALCRTIEEWNQK